METTAGTTVFEVVVLFWIIRAIVKAWQNPEKETETILRLALADTQTNEPKTEKEKMTPNYLPPPNEAGDGNDKNQKGDMK